MKVKFCIVLFIVSLIAILGGQSLAGEFSATGWEQPIRMHVTGYGQGTIWRNADGSDFAPPGTYPNPWTHPDLTRLEATGAIGEEDTWGIIRIDQILPGYVDEDHRNIEPTGDPPLWALGDDGIELWGIFYGHKDEHILVNDTGGQHTLGTGLKIKVFAQPLGHFSSVHGPLANKQFGSADRGATQDVYAGIGDAGSAYLWMSGTMQVGFFHDPADPSQVSTYTLAAQFWPPGNQDGEAQAWMEFDEQVGVAGVDYGTANATFDRNWYESDLDPAYTADLRIQMDNKIVSSPTADFDWLLTISDPIQTYGVPGEEEEGCRMTGGGNDTYTEEGDGPLNNKLAKGQSDDNGSRYTFGGQAGAPTGCQPQPWGEWTHSHHSGMKASFTFHAGTASAPENTEIDWIACSDPGWCRQARPAPNKQIDFAGVGTFKNIRLRNGSPLSWMQKDVLYDFYVHIEDLGEPGKGGKVDPPEDFCPPAGSAGALADCECPDFYWITIFNPDEDGEDYTVYGYIKGGNLQIHPALKCK